MRTNTDQCTCSSWKNYRWNISLLPRLCFHFRNHNTIRIRGETRASQVIPNDEVQRSTGPHGDALRTGVVILRDSRTTHLIIISNEVSGGRANVGRDDRLYAIAIPIIGEGSIREDGCRRHGRRVRQGHRLTPKTDYISAITRSTNCTARPIYDSGDKASNWPLTSSLTSISSSQ